MRVFAFDHRMQLEEMDGRHAREDRRLQAALPAGRARGARTAAPATASSATTASAAPRCTPPPARGLWIGRPGEWPGSRPLTLEPELGSDYGGLSEWAREDVVKVLCFCHPDDTPEMRAEQEATVKRLWEASRRNRLEFLLEIIPSKVGPVDDDTTATLIRQFYAAGVWPDWWKLEPMTSRAAWANAIAAIEAHDRHTRGIVVLGLDAPEAELAASFETAAGFDLVKGFAVGRTIFGEVARAWMAGAIDDAAAVAEMAAALRPALRDLGQGAGRRAGGGGMSPKDTREGNR